MRRFTHYYLCTVNKNFIRIYKSLKKKKKFELLKMSGYKHKCNPHLQFQHKLWRLSDSLCNKLYSRLKECQTSGQAHHEMASSAFSSISQPSHPAGAVSQRSRLQMLWGAWRVWCSGHLSRGIYKYSKVEHLSGDISITRMFFAGQHWSQI